MTLLREEKPKKIELIPLIDIVFLLLIFFVVTSIITGQGLFASFIEALVPFEIPELSTQEETNRAVSTNLLIQVYQQENEIKDYILSQRYGPKDVSDNNYMNWVRKGGIPKVESTPMAEPMGQNQLTKDDVKETLALLKRLSPQSKVTIRGARDIPFYHVIDLYNCCVDQGFSINLSYGSVNSLNQDIQ